LDFLFFTGKKVAQKSIQIFYRKWVILKHENHQNLHWKKKTASINSKAEKTTIPKTPFLPSFLERGGKT